MTTDTDTDITDEQIRALMTEAGNAGDDSQVAICRRALDELASDQMTWCTVEHARTLCAQVIADARAMDDK